MSDQEKRIQEIRERADAATPGPWDRLNQSIVSRKENWGCSGLLHTHIVPRGDETKPWMTENDAEFIANARQDIPHLLDLVEPLQREREQQEPKPLTREQIVERMFKPVYCAGIKRWGVVGARLDKYTIGFGYGFEWLDDMMRRGEIYATEPKGDATT